jgi:hypothetical protein
MRLLRQIRVIREVLGQMGNLMRASGLQGCMITMCQRCCVFGEYTLSKAELSE